MPIQSLLKAARPRFRRTALFSAVGCLGLLASACQGGHDSSSDISPKLETQTLDPAGNLGELKQAIAGKDGGKTISAANTVVNKYTPLTQAVAAASKTLKVGSLAALTDGTALALGDLLLIVQMQGATLNTANANAKTWGDVSNVGGAGLYEFVEVASVSGTDTITLACGLKNAYAITGNTQVIRVPQYDTLTVDAAGSLSAPAWNGTVGGIAAVHVKNALTLNGEIDVSATGFRGGLTDNNSRDAATAVTLYASTFNATTNPTANSDGGQKGEGIGGLLNSFGRGPAGNGGGGGNSHNGGGGGGANGRSASAAAWTGRGAFDTTVTGAASAWPLDPLYQSAPLAAVESEGGGRGGYTYSISDQNALTVAPGNTLWDGNNRRDLGGLGGHPLDNDPANRVFLGGGGGAGDGNDGKAGAGGRGGGLVFVVAGQVAGSGTIRANGEKGADATSANGANGDAPGGGGAGGSVVVQSASVNVGLKVQANGGAGGTETINNNAESEGPGGGGGGGFIWVSGTPTVNADGGNAGTTTSPAMAEFPVNGATKGASGLIQLAATSAVPVPYCTDTTGPDTNIATKPANPTKVTTGAFTFTSPEAGATFECQVDAGVYAACTSPFTTAVLAAGAHTFNVRAKDGLGNVDASPAGYSWTIDLTAPDTTIAPAPQSPTNDNTPSIGFTSETGATFQCRIGSGTLPAFAACASPFVPAAPLADGTYTFEVVATDIAGNVDPTPATTQIIVDTAPPDTSFTSTPPSPNVNPVSDFSFVAPLDAGATFQCQLDAAASFSACSSPFSTPPLGDGSHTLKVRAVDAAGNIDPTPVSFTWMVDSGLPDTLLDSMPPLASNSTSATIEFHSDVALVTFECSVDAGLAAVCTSPLTLTGLTEGVHNFSVRAKNGMNNYDPSPATFTWSIDTTAPDTTISANPAASSLVSPSHFEFSSPSDVSATFECQLDASGTWAACTGLYDLLVAPGNHQLQVRAVDAAGNRDASPASAAWLQILDTDGDGISDADEAVLGTSPTDADSDDDGVPDGAEPNPGDDTDHDGLINALDPDSDNDAIFDGTELGKTTPGAGTDVSRGRFIADADALTTTDPLKADTDNGGVPDGAEDSNHNGKVDGDEGDPNVQADDTLHPADTDGDGLTDRQEATLGSNPNDADTDNDGVPDGAEPNPGDDTDGDGLINVLDPDSDNDGLFDGTELGYGCQGTGTSADGPCLADADPSTKTSALVADTDKGGVSDGAEDPNFNGQVDADETDALLAADDHLVQDRDGDKLSDAEELALGSDPNDADSDDDGVPDGLEPNPTLDSDGDGLPNILDSDSDNDGLSDGTEMGFDCSNPGTNTDVGHCTPDSDPDTKTSALLADTDRGGVSDGSEDSNLNGALDDGETDPTLGHGADDKTVVDSDDDGLSDSLELTLGSDPNDADTDDDGLLDGLEPNPAMDADGDGLNSVLDVDSDNDGLFDGTEAGLDCRGPGTDARNGHCTADADASTTTGVLSSDTDHGGKSDGSEDSNLDGRVDAHEQDPTLGNDADDDDAVDSDEDGLSDRLEGFLGSDPNDVDSDDDGLPDGQEPNPSDDTDHDGLINVRDPDSDGDKLFDGTEAGRGCSDPATDTSKNTCRADTDPTTRTSVVNADTDFGGVSDGVEDRDHDGQVGGAETDPLDPDDDHRAGFADGGAGEDGGILPAASSSASQSGAAPTVSVSGVASTALSSGATATSATASPSGTATSAPDGTTSPRPSDSSSSATTIAGGGCACSVGAPTPSKTSRFAASWLSLILGFWIARRRR